MQSIIIYCKHMYTVHVAKLLQIWDGSLIVSRLSYHNLLKLEKLDYLIYAYWCLDIDGTCTCIFNTDIKFWLPLKTYIYYKYSCLYMIFFWMKLPHLKHVQYSVSKNAFSRKFNLHALFTWKTGSGAPLCWIVHLWVTGVLSGSHVSYLVFCCKIISFTLTVPTIV